MSSSSNNDDDDGGHGGDGDDDCDGDGDGEEKIPQLYISQLLINHPMAALLVVMDMPGTWQYEIVLPYCQYGSVLPKRNKD